MDQPYWIRHPDGPFVTLIAVATTYLHPEADELELLQERAKDDDSDPEMRVFKAELRQAIAHPGQLPGDELSRHVQYRRRKPGNVPATALAEPLRRRAGHRNRTGLDAVMTGWLTGLAFCAPHVRVLGSLGNQDT
jgi:hypothetical protein